MHNINISIEFSPPQEHIFWLTANWEFYKIIND